MLYNSSNFLLPLGEKVLFSSSTQFLQSSIPSRDTAIYFFVTPVLNTYVRLRLSLVHPRRGHAGPERE
jgi:hypothetical protein